MTALPVQAIRRDGILDDIVRKSLLYDFYGELLTEHQKAVYGDYIQNDLSLSELAGLSGISRQAAYDMVKRCEKLLGGYEDRLHLVEHYLKVKKMVARIREDADLLAAETEDPGKRDPDQLQACVREIVELSDAILEEY